MHYHIIGIGGAGMSAIAHLLLDRGHTVSGSDTQQNGMTAALAERGAQVFHGHRAEQITGADALVITSAVRGTHPEVAAAQSAGIPVLKRADLWREWSHQRPVVAVAGTHGKTTTTAMIALMLEHAGKRPGFLIGATVPDLGVNARWGDDDAPLVIEADEYDRTFLALTPHIAVITNIEWDHVDIYASAEDYDAAFAQFAASVADQRNLIVCGDDPGVERVITDPQASRYGIDALLATDPVSCRRVLLDWTASTVRETPDGVQFGVWHYSQRTFATHNLGTRQLRLSGTHSVQNALATIAVGYALGIDQQTIAAALAAYRGTGRRFEHKGEAGGITIIDDYAHHPTEVQATLQAARGRYGERRLVAYVQPHTYSRTAAMLEEWATAFGDADLVRVGAIYAAREQDTLGMSDAVVAARLRHDDARAVGGLDAAVTALLDELRPGDVLLTLGAGDGVLVGERILARLQQPILSDTNN